MTLVHVHVEEVPASGAWNMAVDEALLEDALERGEGHLRFYAWSEPTVSLGYFQSSHERLADDALGSLPAVRRLSGGGAILHDRELTYSCVVPPGHRLARDPLALYDVVHESFVTCLAASGIEVAARGSERAHAEKPFLCFSRGDERDLVCRGHKVLGSAQRRRRGAVLQHGSLLLEHSPWAPGLPGLRDLVSAAVPRQLARQLADRIAPLLGSPRFDVPADSVAARARRLASAVYSHLDWRDGIPTH